MSTVERTRTATRPPLVAGDRLDQPTFHERYEAMPPGTVAELIGGIVYMPPVVGSEHGDLASPEHAAFVAELARRRAGG